MEENTTVIAVDIAKVYFEIAVSETPGRVSEHHRLKRAGFLAFFKGIPPATVVMEACGSAHHWGREIEALRHKIVLLPPHQVRPYVTRNKTDRTDAKGILEAFRNDDIHPVPVKAVDQQVLVSIHRFRSGWIGARTAQVNTLRGLLREIGFFIPEGIKHVAPQVRLLVEDADSKLPDALRSTLSVTCDQVDSLSQLIKKADRELQGLADQSPSFERLASAPGIGLIVGTALLGFVGTPHRASDRVEARDTLAGSPNAATPTSGISSSTARVPSSPTRAEPNLMTGCAPGPLSSRSAPPTTKPSSPSPTRSPGLPGRCGGTSAPISR